MAGTALRIFPKQLVGSLVVTNSDVRNRHWASPDCLKKDQLPACRRKQRHCKAWPRASSNAQIAGSFLLLDRGKELMNNIDYIVNICEYNAYLKTKWTTLNSTGALIFLSTPFAKTSTILDVYSLAHRSIDLTKGPKHKDHRQLTLKCWLPGLLDHS